MTDYDSLRKLFEDKSILYIPIYSCFNYQTGLLNFKADGNINRFLSTFINCNTFSNITILEPPSGTNKEWFDNCCKDYLNNCTLLECELITKSAKVERSIDFAFNVVEYIKNETNLDKFDYIICEAQHVFLRLYNNKIKNKLIYWCPVCATNDKTRDFLEPFKEIDKYIFSISKTTILASNDQVNFFNTIPNHGTCIQMDKMIDRSLPIFDYEVNGDIISLIKSYNCDNNIFLPFRLTDMGYQTQDIIDFLYNDYKNTKSYKVFYSNPNNCDIYRFANGDSYKKLYLDRYFVEVPKDREVFYSIIDHCNVIIPYFEDLDFIAHSSIFEFEHGDCKVCKTLDEFKELLLS